MCGICGVFHYDRNRAVDRSALEAMNRSIVHRGPDDDGFFVDGNVGLAMRRLSIIDLEHGAQPISDESGALTLVYNGEIYNHLELREGLVEAGHVFRSRSDTEAIVHGVEDEGKDWVRRLRGMFAFALWDARRRRLLLARDRVGIKPLYLLRGSGHLLFGSEIKAILAHPLARAALDVERLPEYLAFGYLSGEGTLFRGITKLPPGCTLEIGEDGVPHVERYWDISYEPDPGGGFEEAADRYRAALEEAVAGHMMSDVPLGVFLSGGIDSSTVAALVKEQAGGEVETFSVGYREEAASELGYARTVAEAIGTRHHEVVVGEDEFFAALPRLVWHEDEPIVWPSSVSLYFVARLASERVKVVLTGEGSDETLAGYTRYRVGRWNARLSSMYRQVMPGPLRRKLRRTIAAAPWIGAGLRRKLEHTFLAWDESPWPVPYLEEFYTAFSSHEQGDLLADGPGLVPASAYAEALALWEASEGDVLSRLLYLDMRTYLGELLMKQDNMSMAASIESRVPFLDNDLIDLAATLPSAYKVRGTTGKRILKRAVRGLIPDEIVRRPKMGFPTPLRGWLQGGRLDAVATMLEGDRCAARGLLRPPAVRRIIDEHRRRQRDHTDRIWRLLNLELWCRVFLDGEVPGPVEPASGRMETAPGPVGPGSPAP